MQSTDRYRLEPETVRFTVSEQAIASDDTQRLPGRIIGQPRAVEALHLALAIRAKGYNVFAAGYSGTGKRSAVMRILMEQPFEPDRLRDVVYVHNFAAPDRPRALRFSAGDARRFRARIEELIEALRDRVPQEFERGAVREKRDAIMLETERRESDALKEFEERLSSVGFTMVQIKEEDEQRSDICPIVNGEPVAFDELQEAYTRGQIPPDEWHATRAQYYRHMDEMNQIFATLRTDRSGAERRLRKLQRETIAPLIGEAVAAIRRDFIGSDIHDHLAALEADLIENVALLLPVDGPREQDQEADLLRYNVHIVVDHADTARMPVVFESHPDFVKLFGSQDPGNEHDPRPPFLGLRGGSILAAAGGYLVLRAEDVVSQEEIWNSLKRVLQDGVTEIRTPSSPYGAPPVALKPEPVAVDLKVVLMGSETLYDFLFYRDEEFGKLFKVLSEFDSVMDNTPETRRGYLDFMRMICTEEHLLPVDPSGQAAVLEYGVRLGEFRSKLSTRFSLIADLLRESSHWARRAGGEVIDRAAVEKARDVRRYLHNLPEEKYDEQISSGEMILQVSGERVGAINGLSVLDRGYYAFGRPMLITARVAPGTDGIINIERESGLSGELHDKGMYILQGFLQATYATDFPLSVNASIGFEQSYVEVDGDSASSTEIYVLLSAISRIALRQDVAVTGSVNQFGQVQPVGGVSEKIEGFYETCRLVGLTGTQGVIIPRTNVQNLVLGRTVQTAIDEGQFHIWAIERVDQGMEILTGRAAGERSRDGHFPSGTVNGIVERRLREMAAQVKEFS